MAIVSAVLWAVLVPSLQDVASGQDRGRRRRTERRTAAARAEAAERTKAPPAPEASDASGDEADTADPDAPETSASDTGATSREIVEGGSKVKVIQFSGFDVDGRLKSPQLLYFLNRMRAEFDRPRLPHRSFVPELERSTKTDGF